MEKNVKQFFLTHWGIILAILLTVFAIIPLTRPGLFPMHDDEQVGRLYELDQAVKNGHFPPRIATNLGFGYGYPLFNFYPSFVYYVAEVFVLLGFSYITSIKLMIATGFIAAAFFMYLFAKEYFGKFGGIIAAVFYTYAPYHALDVYVRGALPEFWSFAFIPAIFWSLKKLQETGYARYVVYVALSLCGLILTHNLVAFMSGFFIGIYGIYLLVTAKEKRRFFLQAVLGGVMGVLTPAYFWVPSYFEKKYTMIELLTTELADYRQHFVYLRQLWNSPWGYGGSLYGLYDGLSFQIGKAHIILSLFIAGGAGILSVVKKQRPSVIYLFLVFFLLSVFLMTFYSQFIWDSIQQLSYIQFPWRFLLFAAFTSSFLIGGVVLLPLPKKYLPLITAVVVLMVIGVNVQYFQPLRYWTTVTDADYTTPEVLRWRTSIMAFEYVPRGIATKPSPVGTTVIDIDRSEVAEGTHRVVSGPLQVTTLSDSPHEKRLAIRTGEPGILQLNTYAFPGWKVFLNGKEVSYSANNKLKLITVPIPEGEYILRAVFTDTVTRAIGNLASGIGLGGLFLYIWIDHIGKKHRHRAKKSS